MMTINPCRSPIIMCYFLNSLNVALTLGLFSNPCFISIPTESLKLHHSITLKFENSNLFVAQILNCNTFESYHKTSFES